jgi:hypothetical protein
MPTPPLRLLKFTPVDTGPPSPSAHQIARIAGSLLMLTCYRPDRTDLLTTVERCVDAMLNQLQVPRGAR